MIIYQNGAWTQEYLAELERIEQLKAERGPTKPFEVGKTYLTREGKTVTCLEVTTTPGYECARFDDPLCEGGGWRYNRDGIDRGRVTGTPFDHSDPRCVIPESAA